MMTSKIRRKFLYIRRKAIAEGLTSVEWCWPKDHRTFVVRLGKQHIAVFYNEAESESDGDTISAMDYTMSIMVEVYSLKNIKNYNALAAAYIKDHKKA
jgi:hypothetical protein